MSISASSPNRTVDTFSVTKEDAQKYLADHGHEYLPPPEAPEVPDIELPADFPETDRARRVYLTLNPNPDLEQLWKKWVAGKAAMARYERVLAEWQEEDNIYWRTVEDVRKQQGRIKEIEAAALVADVTDQQNAEDTDQREGVKTPPPPADLGSGSSASTAPLVLPLPTGTEREALQQKLSDPEFVALWKVGCLLYAGGPASGQQMQPIGDPEVACDECERAASTGGSRVICLFSNNGRIQCLSCSENPSKPRCSLSHHHIALRKFIKEKTYLPSRILPVNHYPRIVTNGFDPEKPWTKSKGEATVGKLDITLNDMAIIQQRKAQIRVRTTMSRLNELQSVILSSVVPAGEDQHAWLTLFSDFEAQAISDLTLLNEVLQCQRKKKEL